MAMGFAEKSNILSDLPSEVPTEIFQTIVKTQNIEIERIISQGQKSADGFWYDLDRSEWVLVIKGKAQLEFEDRVIDLTAGDYVNIEAHQKHRVKWTSPDEETIWLAIFY